jgi:hypothetical protein
MPVGFLNYILQDITILSGLDQKKLSTQAYLVISSDYQFYMFLMVRRYITNSMELSTAREATRC